MIKIENMSKRLEDKPVLTNLNWKIYDGRVYGLVGPNGSGKSTILRLIAGIYQCDEGMITIDAEPVYENPEIKNKVMFVSDDPFFLHQVTLNDMQAFYKTFYPDFNDELYHKMLDIFKLDTNVKINTFSKGMRRQASLILAFSTGFTYLLLDEAFDGLDPVMRLALKRLISDEIINKQICVIISSHNIRELEDIADEIILIQNGDINLSGDIDTIRKTYHKYQMAFAHNVDEEQFKDIGYNEITINSKFATIVTKEDDNDKLSALDPLIIEELPMSLEEIFVYHMKEHGYGQDI